MTWGKRWKRRVDVGGVRGAGNEYDKIYCMKFPKKEENYCIFVGLVWFRDSARLCSSGGPGTHYITRLDLNSKRCTCLCHPSARMNAVYHYVPYIFLKETITNIF